MYNYINDNKGNVLLTVLAVVIGIMLGLSLVGPGRDAEAVLGGPGNVKLSNNPHNFASNSTGVKTSTSGEDRICIYCHTPHNAITDSSLINGPLWNHTLSSASYTVNSPGLSNRGGPPGIVNQLTTPPTSPDGASKMCLSCHDGTISIGSLNTETIAIDTSHSCIDADGSMATSCADTIGTDLRTKHVISIPMNNALITASLANCTPVTTQTTKLSYPWAGSNPQATIVLLRPTNRNDPTYGTGVTYPTGAMPSSKYKSGYMYGVQCSTCHDPHYWIDTANANTAGYKFLVTGFNNLCNACHDAC